MLNLSDTLALLAKQRPIFHSEADFQHALAWLIHLRDPAARIRLEYRLSELRNYLDLWIQDDEWALAIELKYPTRDLSVDHGDERFSLLNHGAQDITRYDFIKDMVRLEGSVGRKPGVTGYAVMVTNDSVYWVSPARSDTIDAAFRIQEGACLSGTLTWGPDTGAGTMKGRESALELRGFYEMSWHDYSIVSVNPNAGRFRYLLVRVDLESP